MKITITEEQQTTLQANILKMIESLGLLDTIKMTGGYSNFLKMMKGVDWRKLNISNIIQTINLILEGFDNFLTLIDLGLNPITISDDDGELCQIESLYNDSVQVYCYGGYKYETELGDYEIDYENLDFFDLVTIFDAVMDYQEDY